MVTKKTTSAAVLITDGENFLLGHITGKDRWDIPKGNVETGETFLQSATRELREETGINASPTSLILLGYFNYTNVKNLVLYVYPITQMPDVTKLKCTSMFTDKQGQRKPELDQFQIVHWDNIQQFVRPELVNILTQTRTRIKEIVKNNV